VKGQKISVIMPVYNSEQFISESLNSILNQTYSNYEIICIDDGSSDKSNEILMQYSDKINLISQENRGLSSALNAGIEKMNGDWVKWFSPDDIMYPNTLETLINTTKEFDSNTVFYSNWDIINDKGEKLRSFSESNYNDLDVDDFNVRLLDGQQINVNTTLFPKSIFKNSFRMNPSLDPVLVDYDLFLRCGLLNKSKFYLIEKPLIKFRIHGNQLSHNKIVNTLKNLEFTKNQILNELDLKTKNDYIEKLKQYKKTKPFSRRSLESGLKLISSILPQSTTDKILVFYLNKIRSSR
jgi:glycosyltransferase involved in cell wall biosynthesis